MNEFFDRVDGYRRQNFTTSEMGPLKNMFLRFKRVIIAFFVFVVLFVFVIIRLISIYNETPVRGETEWYQQQQFYLKYIRNSQHTYDISFISDDDKLSRRNPDKLVFSSTMLSGKLKAVFKRNSGAISHYELTLYEDNALEVSTTYNEKGRGAEFSDLCNYRDKLLAFDDRTGIIFWYNRANNKMIPYVVLIEGNAIDSDKGQKTEWAFVAPSFYNNGKRKDHDAIYIGSIGKEWTDPKTGEIQNFHNQWVKIVEINPPKSSEYGNADLTLTDVKNVNDYSETIRVEHLNVRENLFEVMRKKTDALNPGYIVHEAACYNSKYNNWWFLPRRHSHETYNEDADERAGTDLVFVINSTDPFHATAAENEAKMDVRHIGVYNNTRGWSSCKFLPYQEDHLLAIRSMEVNNVVATYATVIDITTNKILLPETFLGWKKYEGVEFI